LTPGTSTVSRDAGEFTLLAAIGGCTTIDTDILTSRLAEPDSFQVRADVEKVRHADGNRLTDIEITFRIAFPVAEHGDEARAILPDLVLPCPPRWGAGCSCSAGVPLGERLLMWSNLVARTPDEIAAAAADWREGRFGTVADYDGEPLAARPLDVARLIPRR
jgi:putative redox protein